MPLSSFEYAEEGHTSRQIGSAQWLHEIDSE
jgi:hypothetical protein